MSKTMCVVLSDEMYHKVHVLHTIRKYCLDDRVCTISSMTEQALKEYFENHDNVIQNMMKQYHDKGGCFEL